jgi:hypothetical protein
LTSGTTVDGITSNNRDVAITESAGTIAVNQPVNASASGDVTLKAAAGFSLAADGDITGNTITFDNTSTGGVSQDTSSAITANTGLLVTGVYTAAINFAGTANKVKVFAANTNGAAITLVNSDNVNNLTIGSLTTVSGITSNGRAVTITERTGTITVNQPVASGAAAVSVTASAAGGSISTDASPDGDITGTSITLTADAMTLSGNLDATLAGRVTVRNATAGRPIYIGAAAAVSGRLDLLNSVLSSGRLTAATLEVGRADTYASGQITIDASVNLSFVTTLVLRTGAGITNNTGSSIDVSNLAIQAGTVTSSAVTISPAPATQNIAINASGDITIGPTAGFGFNMYSYSGTTPAISGLSGHDITLDCTAGQNVTQSPGAPVTASGSLSLRRGIYKLYLSNNQAASFVGGGPLISGGILELTGNSRLAITGTITLHDGFEVNNAHATDPAFLRAGANVTVGTNVTFGGAATPPNYVTLEMIGSGSLDAASSIGHLVLTPGSTETVTLQRPLTLLGNVTIESGKTLDVSASHHKITIEGNWTQGATGSFTHRQGEVEFIGTTVSISGNTTWYKFTCTAPGASLRFSNYANAGDCHNIMPGGTFTVKGASGTPVTLTNATDSGSPTMSPAPPSPATAFWRLYLHPGATLDMENVDVKYSWAWPDPIPIPYGKNINAEYDTTWYDYNWVHLKTFVYAFTEDMDGNGRIDRIRLQSTVYLQTSAPNWWEGLAVTVMGYEKEDIPTGTFSIQGGPYTITDDSLWVYVKEKNYSDGGETPLINVANTTLRDSATGQLIDGTNGLVSTDTVAPRINYALALPGGNDVFLQASEVLAAGSLSISSPGTPSELGGGEFLITGASPGGFSLTELASGSTTFTVIGGSDTASPPGVIPSQVEGVLPKLPVAYSSSHPGYAYYDGTNYTIAYSNSAGLPFPNSFNPPISHRVTDVLISIPPVSPSDPWYFVWPIWAKYLSPPNDSGFPADGAAWTGGGAQATDTGIIWDFTGRKALEERDTTLQVLRNSALSGDPKLVFAFNVPREYRNPPEYNTGALGSSGLWLPGSIASFINLVPRYYSLPSGSPLSHNSNPLSDYYIYQFDKDDPGYDSPSRLDFLFSLPVSPADLFAARLDTAASGPWYRRVRPFSYDIHDTTLQRGGVTILNNVINSNKGETVFIRYHLVNSGRVTVQVFTLDGTLIKTLRRENRSAGEWTESWNGSNNSGRPVARGLYFIRVVAPDIDEIRKVMVVK